MALAIHDRLIWHEANPICFQVWRWAQQYKSQLLGAPMPEMMALIGWLQSHIPAEDSDPSVTRISHGDFRRAIPGQDTAFSPLLICHRSPDNGQYMPTLDAGVRSPASRMETSGEPSLERYSFLTSFYMSSIARLWSRYAVTGRRSEVPCISHSLSRADGRAFTG